MNIRWRMTFPALLLALSSSCLIAPDPPPQWVEAGIQSPTEQVLWDASLQALQKHDYPLGATFDRSAGYIVSGWKTSLAAFRGQGWREKAWIEFERKKAGDYLVKVRVQRETNEDIVRPLDPSYADWEPAQDDTQAARILLQTIRSYLGTELDLDSDQAPPKQ
jgi:hypothetical protein